MQPNKKRAPGMTGARPYAFVILTLGIPVFLAACAGSGEHAALEAWSREMSPAVETVFPDPGEPLPGLGPNPELEDYIRLAGSRNRSAFAAREEWKAALERMPQARALPDPLLTYGYFLQSVETRVGPQKQRAGIMQTFPWFGTLGLKGEAAARDAEVAHQRYREALLGVVREVSVAYAEYYYLGSALRITRDNIDLLTGWEGILRARYTTGSVTYSDLIKVQVELGKLQDLRTTLERQRAPRASRLRALLDLPVDIPLPWPATLPEPEPLEPVEALRDRLLDGNTELKALAARVERAEVRRELAGKASLPDFSLGIDWIQTDTRDLDLEDNGKDAVVAMVGVRLPIWTGSRSAGRREAAAAHTAALEHTEDRRNFLLSELEELAFRYEDAERKTTLYRDSLIPKGNQSLEAAFAAFESGKGDFLSVLDAERALLEFGLSLERARADLVQARARTDFLTGREWIRGER